LALLIAFVSAGWFWDAKDTGKKNNKKPIRQRAEAEEGPDYETPELAQDYA
jgi:hypothetical protein